MKHSKKILSLILSVLMVLSVFSGTVSTALAAETYTGVADIYNGFAPPAAGSRAARANLDYIQQRYSGAIAEISKGFNSMSEEIVITKYNIDLDELNNILTYLEYYKLYYYVANEYHYRPNVDGTVYSLIPTYTMSKSAVIAGNQMIKEKMDRLVSAASKLSTDIEKIIYVHDYVVGNIEYDYKNYDQAHNNIYNALKDGVTMCEGYSETFNYALSLLDIKSYIITSNANVHAWNLVYLDGNYYHVDCTFDDPYYENPNLLTNPVSGNYSYENLMCSDSLNTRNGHEAKDWEVNGYNVYGYASSQVYDNFFWRGIDEHMVYSNGYWCFAYAKESNSSDTAGFKICEAEFYSNTKYNIKEVRDINSCYRLSNGQKSKVYYPELQSYAGDIYYKTDKGIYVYNPDSDSDILVFKPERTDNIYDFVIDEDNKTFSVVYGDRPTDRGVVLTYDIDEYFCNILGHSFVWKTINNYQVNCCSKCGFENYRLKFTDLKGYEIYDDYVVYTSMHNNFIAGTNPPKYTLFSPRTAITRAMFVAILYRMAGNPYDGANPYTSNPFSDVSPSAYYYNAACWALDEGITNQKTFKPNNNVTREQTARFLFAYAESKGLLGDEAYKNVNLSRYPDYNSVHNWAVEPLQWANYNNMITGTSQGYINPQGATQRIHATRILYGFGKVCNIGNFE